MSELERQLDFARQTIHEAGVLTLGWFRRRTEVVGKADGSPVTIADRDAEALVRRAIESAFPDHGIHGEEHGVKDPAPGCSFQWFIDPIDGTKSFIHGVPLYTNLLALLRDGEPVLGVINAPATGEQLSAASGLGAWLNGRRARVSETARVQDALLLTSDHRDLDTRAPAPGWRALYDACRYPRSWGDAYMYLMVATGRGDIALDARVEAYDVAPMPVVLREAGGAFFDWTGAETIRGGHGIAVNAALEGAVREALGIG